MLSDFAQETLDLAQSLTAHHIEVNRLWSDEDFCVLMIGNSSEVVTSVRGNAEFCINHAGRRFTFGNVTAAIQAADKYETAMLAIADAANASRQTQEVA